MTAHTDRILAPLESSVFEAEVDGMHRVVDV